jgi:hypothetical protein
MAGLVMVAVVLGIVMTFPPWKLPPLLLGLELGGEARGVVVVVVVVVPTPRVEVAEVKIGVAEVMEDAAVVTILLLLVLLAVPEEVGVVVVLLALPDTDVIVRPTAVSAVVYKTNRNPDTVSKLYKQAAPVLTRCTSPISSSLGLNLPHNSRNDNSIPNMSFS